MPAAAGHAGTGPAESNMHPQDAGQKKTVAVHVGLDESKSPLSPGLTPPAAFARRDTSLDLDDYFVCLHFAKSWF